MNDKLTQWLYENEYQLHPDWPQATCINTDTPLDEPQELEELQIVSVTDNAVIFYCGAHWQNPQKLKLTQSGVEVLEFDEWPNWNDDFVLPGWISQP